MSNLLLVFVVTSTSTLLLSNVYGNYSLDPSNESKGLHCQVTVECKRFWIDTPVCGKGVYTEDGNVVLILVGIDCNGERIHRYNTIWYMIAKSSHIAIRQCRDRLKCTVPEKYLHPKGDRKFVVVVTERNIARHLEIKLKYIKERKLRIHGSTNDRNENYENRQERPQKKDDDLTEKVLRILGDRKYENHKIKEKNQYKKEDNKVHNKKDKIRDDKKVEHVNDSKDGSVNSDKTEKVDNKVRKDSKLRDSRGNVQHINTEDNRLKKNDKLHSENKLLVRGDTKPAMPNHERGQEIRNKKDGPKVPKGNELRGNEKNEDVNHIKIVINRSINYSNESELHDSTKNGIMNLTKTGKNRHNKGNGNKLPAHGENQDGNKISKKSKYENDNVDIHYFIDIIPISELSKTNNSTDSNENDKRDAETIDTILKHKSLDNNSSGFETNSTSITRQNRKNIKNIDLKKSKKITENLIKNLDALLSPESQELDIKEAADDKDFNLIPRPPVLLVDSFKPKSKRARPKYKRPHRTKHLLGNLPKGLKMFKGINHNDRNESLITTTHGDIHDIVDGNEKKKQESLTNTHDKEGNGVLSKNTPGNTPVSTLDFRKEIVDIPSDYKNTYIDSRIDKIPIGQTIVRHIDNPSNLNSTNMGVIYHGTLNNNRTSWHGEYIKVSKHQLRKLQEVFHRRKQQDALKSKLRYNMMNNYIRNTQKQLKEKDQKLKQKEMFDDKKVNDMKKELMIQNISNDEKTREKDKELKAKIVSKVKDLDEEVKELKERNANTQKMKKKDADLKEKGKLHSKKFGTQVSSVRQKVSIPVAPEIDSSVGNDVENGKELIEVVQRKKIFGNVRYPSINRKLVETENFGIKRDGDHNARRLQNDEMKKVPANEIINVMTRNRLYPNKFYPKYHYGIREDMFSQPEILIPLNSHHIINANAEELKQHENLYFHKRIHEDASSLKDRLSCKAASPKIDEQIESALSSIEGNIYRILAEKTQVESKYSNKLQKQVHDATFTVIVDSLNKSCSHRLNANERIGELTNWESWGNCSVECGEGGFQLRKRSCTTNKCVGSLWDVKECSEHKPCRANWMKWSSWGPCSSSCDKGYRTKTRICVSQVPTAKCSGNFIKVQSCNSHRCQKLNYWTEWSSWSGCSVSCGTGFQERLRDCKLQATSITSLPSCEGSSYEHRLCVHSSCSGGSGAILDSISKFQSAAMICDRATREHSNYVIWKTPDRNIITSKTQTDRIKISGPYLIIHNLKESDRGLYKCALLSKLPYTMSTHDCRSHLCLNGGQCIEQSHIGVSNSLFVCICKSGYGGVYCAEEIGLRSAHIIGIVFLVITLGTAKVLILYFCCRFRKSVDFKILKEITKEDGTKKSVVERLKSALLCCKGPNDEVNVQKTNVKSKPPQKTKNVPKVMKETQTLPEAVLTMENNPSAKKGQSSTSRNTLFGVRSSLKDDINNLLDGVTGAIKKGSTNVRSSKPKVVKDTDNSLDNIIKGIKKHITCTSKEKSPSAFRRNTLTVGGTTTGSIRNARDPSTAMNNVSIDSNSDTTSIHDTDSEYDIENKRSKHSFGETLYYPIPAVKAIPMTTDNKPDDNSKKTSEDLNNSLLDHARVILSSGTNISSQNEGPGIKTDNSNIQLNFSVSKEDAVGKKPEKLYSRKEDIKVSDKSTKSMGNAIRGLGEIEMCTTGDYELKSVPFKITSLSDRSAENKKVYQVTPHPKMLQSKPLAVDPKENNQSEIGKKAVADSDSERAQNAQVKTIEFSETVNDRARQTDSETPSAKFEASGSISDDPKKREISSRLEILSDEFKKIDDTVYCNTHKTSVFIEALNNIGHYIVSCEHGFMPMVIDDEMFSICCREHHLRISDLLDGYTAGYSKGQHEKSSNQSNLENSTIPSHTNDKMLQSPMEEVKSMHISGCDKERFISMDDFFIKSITITPSSSVGSVESNKSYQISSRSKPIQSPKLTEVELYRAPLSPSPTDGFNSVPMVLPQTEEAKSILTSEHDRGSFNSAPITSDFLLKSGIITPSTSVGSIKSEESYQTLSKSLLSPQRTDKVELCRAPLSPSQTGGFKSAPMVPPRTEEAKSILSSEHDKGKLNSVPINCDFLLKSFTITPSTSVGSIESEKSYQTSSLSQPLPSPQRRDNVEFYRAPLSPLKTDGFISGPMTPPRTEEAKGSLNSRSFESKTGDFLLKSITITPSASVCNVKSKKSHQTSTEILMSGDSAQPKIDLLASSHSDSIYSAASSLSRTGGAKNSTETKTNCQSGYERIDRSNNWDVCERKVGEQVDKEIEEDFQNLKKADPQLLSQFQTVSTPKKGDKISLIAQELSFGKQEIHDISNVSLKSMPNLDESQYFNPIENISEDSQNTTKSTDNGSNDMSLLSATEKGQSSVKDGTGRYGGKESVDLSDANYTFSPETTENCSSITNPGLSEKKPETSANLSKQISINSKTTIISSSDSKMNSSPQGLVAISRHSSLNELEDVCAVQGNGESCAKSDQLASHSNDTSANDLTERKAYSADNNSVDISLSTSITVSSNAPHSNPLFDPDDNSSVHTVGSVKRLSTLVSPNLKPVSPLNLDKSNNVTGEPNKQNISHLKIDKSSQIPPKVSNNIFPGNMSYKIFTDPLHESMLIESAPVTERCTKYSQYIKQNTDSTANEGIDEDTMPQERDLTETNQYFPNTITEPSLQNRDNDSMSRSTSFYSVDDTPMTLPYVTNTHDKNTQYSSEIRNSCVAEVSLETKTFAVTDADEVYDEYFNMSKFKRIMCPIPEEEDSLDGSVEFKSPYTSTTEFESVIDSESNILRPSASDYKSPWPSEYWLLKNRGEENDNVSDETWLYTESNNSCLCDGNERASSPVWSSFYQDDDKPNPAQF